MEDVIYLIQTNGTLVEITVQPYESEPVLQELLAKYPHLLAGGQMDKTILDVGFSLRARCVSETA